MSSYSNDPVKPIDGRALIIVRSTPYAATGWR